MREDIASGSKRFVSRGLKITRKAVIIATEAGDNLSIAIPDGIADGVKLPPEGTILRNVAVSTSKSGDVLYGFYPAKGTYIVKFDRFSARKNEEPSPKHMDAMPPKGKRTWWSPEKYIFTALLTVQAGDFEGCTIPWIMEYCFDRDVDNTTKFKGSKGQVAKTRRFMELCGFDTTNDTIPYSENILPELEQMLSEADGEPFQVTMVTSESGAAYVDEASELPSGMFVAGKKAAKAEDDFADEEVEDEPVAPPKYKATEDELIGEIMGTGKRKAKPAEDDEFEDDDEDDTPPSKPSPKRKAF